MIRASNRNITSRRALLRGAPAVAAAALAGGTVANALAIAEAKAVPGCGDAEPAQPGGRWLGAE
jgi:hypothetical protein